MDAIVAVAAPFSDLGSSSMVVTRTPSYPNWQRKRIQNPYSVSSNLTEGTTGAQTASSIPHGPCT